MTSKRNNKFSVVEQAIIAFDKWSTLSVWGVDMSGITFKVKKRKGNESTGEANDIEITVRVGRDRYEMYETLLHEMAHAAVARINDSTPDHGVEWREMLLRATEAVLGVSITVPEYTCREDYDGFLTKQFRKHKFKII